MNVTESTIEEARDQNSSRSDRMSNSEEMKGVARTNSTNNNGNTKKVAIDTRLSSQLAMETTKNNHRTADDNMAEHAPKRQKLENDSAEAGGSQSSSENTPSDLTTPMMGNSSSNSASMSDTDSASNNDDNAPARKRMKSRFIQTNDDHDKTMSPMSTSGGTITQLSKAAATLPMAPNTKLTSDSIRRNEASNEGVAPASSGSVPLHVGTNATGSNTSSELAADEEYDRDNDFRDLQDDEERRRHDIILDKTKKLLRESALYAFELVNGYKPPPHLLHGNMGYSSSGGTTASSNRNQQNDGTCSSQDSSSGQDEARPTPMDEAHRRQVHVKKPKPALADEHDDGVEADHEFEEAPMSSSSEDGAGSSSAENSNNSGGNIKRRGGTSMSTRLGHSASKASHGTKGGGSRIHWNVGRGRSTGGASAAPTGASVLPHAPAINKADVPISRLNRAEIEKKITQQRRKQWAKLLEERPPMEDKQRTSEWLLRVFLVSDLESDGSMTAKAFAEQVEDMQAAEQEKPQAPAGMQVGENQPGRQFSHYHDQNQQPGGAPVTTAISTVSSLSEDQHVPSFFQRRHGSKRSRVSDGMADDTSKEASNSDHTK